MIRPNRACLPITCEKRRRGFTLIEVIVAVAIMATIGVAVVSSMNSQIVSAKKNQCMTNLQVIESAKNAWVGDHPGQTMPTPTSTTLPPSPDPLVQYMRGGVVPTCPLNPGTLYLNAYDPTKPAACPPPYHNQQAYPTPTP